MILPKDLLGDSLAVELPALNRATLVRIQVPQPIDRGRFSSGEQMNLKNYKLMGLFVMSSLLSSETFAIPNPAAVNCIEKGGRLLRGNSGVCFFSNGKQCEEWAMMLGYCPVGGISVEGLTSEEKNCLIRGGIILDTATECELPKGEVRSLKEL